MTFTENFSQYAVSKLPTFRDDFSTATAWVGGTAGRTEITGGALEFTFENGGDDSIHADQTSVDDERWVLRAKMVLDTVQNPNTGTTHGFIGVSNNILDITDTQNAIGLRFNRNDTGASTQFVAISTISNIDATPTNSTLFTTIPTASTFFIEIKRISKILVRVTLFSDADYSVIIESQDVTTSPSVNGLQFIKVTNRDAVAQTTPAFIGRFDDIELWNEGQQGDVTFQDDFSSYADQPSADLAWVPVDVTRSRVNIATDVLDLDIIRDNTNDAIAHDLGSTVSDSNWVLRFKLKIDNLNQQALQTQGYFGLFDQDQIAGEETIQSGIGVVLTCFTGTLTYRLFSAENQFIGQGSSTIFNHALAVETVYVEIKRTSLTSYVVNLYSDADFSTLIESQQGITSSGVNDLRYIGMKNNMSMTVSSRILGSMDDVEVYDGVSVAKTPIKERIDFEDNFELDNWTDQGTQFGVNTSTQVIDWDSERTGSSVEQTTFDLETIFTNGVNPDKWALRFRFRINAITPSVPPALSQFAVYLTSLASNNSSELNQDHCTWKVQGDNPPSFTGMVDDATQIFTGASVFIGFDVVPVGETGYGEMTRDGNIFTWAIYSDPDFTQLLGSSKQSITDASTLSGLRFLKIGRRDGTASVFTFNGTVDKIQFWNGDNPTKHGTRWVEVNLP